MEENVLRENDEKATKKKLNKAPGVKKAKLLPKNGK
jgi:hypothetical protein